MFKELLVGTLIYVAVLGFLDDYTDIVHAESFSYLFFASFVLEILTFLTLRAKKSALSKFDKTSKAVDKTKVLFGAWLILFFSKFVFIGVIDLTFSGKVTIYGFFNIFIVVALVTALHRLIDYIFRRLGEANDQQ